MGIQKSAKPIHFDIVATISKLSKECVMRLTNEKVYFIISEDGGGPSPPVLWCEIPQGSFFSEYHMEGVDESHKDIYLGFTSANFAKSLVKLKQNAKSFKLKLTKKQCPCLTLEIEVPSATTMETSKLTHDVPAVVIPRKEWAEYNEPRVPEYDVTISLPTLKLLRMTIDRMKTMSPHIMMKVNPQGKFIVQIKTDLIKVSSRFQGLHIEEFRDYSSRIVMSNICLSLPTRPTDTMTKPYEGRSIDIPALGPRVCTLFPKL